MAFGGCVRGLEEHLAAHSEVRQDRVAVVEGKPEVLASPAGGDDLSAGHLRGEVGGPGGMPAQRPWVEYVDRGDGPPDHMALQSQPDDLYLGKLGHLRGGRRVRREP